MALKAMPRPAMQLGTHDPFAAPTPIPMADKPRSPREAVKPLTPEPVAVEPVALEPVVNEPVVVPPPAPTKEEEVVVATKAADVIADPPALKADDGDATIVNPPVLADKEAEAAVDALVEATVEAALQAAVEEQAAAIPAEPQAVVEEEAEEEGKKEKKGKGKKGRRASKAKDEEQVVADVAVVGGAKADPAEAVAEEVGGYMMPFLHVWGPRLSPLNGPG